MKNGEKSFSKLFELVELISASRGGMSGRELSEASGIPVSTVFRMLKFMAGAGYLKSGNGAYTLGTGFVRLGNVAREQNPLTGAARPVLEELSAATRETVHLAELKDRRIIYVDKVEGARPVRMGSMIGKTGPLYCTGVGKAILAFLPESEREALLEQMDFQPFTANTITSAEAMAEEIAGIRRSGYAVDDCEHEEGVFCVAAPILDYRGFSIAGISISGAEVYIRRETERLASLAVAAARRVSELL